MSNVHQITGREIASVVRSIADAAARIVIPATYPGYENDRAMFSSDFHMDFFYGDGDLVAFADKRTAHRGPLTREQDALIITLNLAVRDLSVVRGCQHPESARRMNDFGPEWCQRCGEPVAA